MCVLHTSSLPGGACMALVPHRDTNQGRWRAPLSCKHQSLLVLFKCLPSLFLLSLTLASPSTPDFGLLSRPLPPTQVQVNPLAGRRGSLREPRPPQRQTPLPGGQPVSQCVGLFPGPAKTISYSNVTIRPLTHWGLFMAAAPGRRVKMVI